MEPSLGRTDGLRLEADAGDQGAVELGESAGAQLEDAFEAGADVIDEGLDVDAEAGGPEGFQEGEAAGQEVDGALAVAPQEGVEAGGDPNDALVEAGAG